MFVNHKTLSIRPRNPTARAALLHAITNPDGHLWSQLLVLYRYTHSHEVDCPIADPVAPQLAEPLSKLSKTDWLRFVQLGARADEEAGMARDPFLLTDSDVEQLTESYRRQLSAEQAAPPAVVCVPIVLHSGMRKQRPVNVPVKTPEFRKRRPVNVPVKVEESCKRPRSRVNQLLRPRPFQ